MVADLELIQSADDSRYIENQLSLTKSDRNRFFLRTMEKITDHRKVLLISFYLNGHTLRFHTPTQKLLKSTAALKTAPQKRTAQ